MQNAFLVGMGNDKLKLIPFPRPASQGGEELLLRSGEIVPQSGIYEVQHKSHEPEDDGMAVVAVKGETVQQCRTCGDQVRLRLLYAAPHVSEDGDFCPPKRQHT